MVASSNKMGGDPANLRADMKQRRRVYKPMVSKHVFRIRTQFFNTKTINFGGLY